MDVNLTIKYLNDDFISKWSPEYHGEMVAAIFNEQIRKNNMAEKENINHPDHYLGTRKYEPIDVINDWELNFQTGNAVKYISRAGRKNKDKTIEDLEKAIWYLQYEINTLKGN